MFLTLSYPKIMRHPKNELEISKTYCQATKTYKRHLENLRHLAIFFLAIFFGISWVCVPQTGFYRLKNHSLRWPDPLKEKSILPKNYATLNQSAILISKKNRMQKRILKSG
jgi:hypothetical protein